VYFELKLATIAYLCEILQCNVVILLIVYFELKLATIAFVRGKKKNRVIQKLNSMTLRIYPTKLRCQM